MSQSSKLIIENICARKSRATASFEHNSFMYSHEKWIEISTDRLNEIRRMVNKEKVYVSLCSPRIQPKNPNRAPVVLNQKEEVLTRHMETPYQNHINKAEFDHVYEPAEDSFLLIDALEKDLEYLKAKKPTICLEVGSGSGIVITAFGMTFPNSFCISTDINFKACMMSKATANCNSVVFDACNMDLAAMFVSKIFDVIIFNPPYVVTESSECGSRGIAASWAGGAKGREITDRLLEMVPKNLSDNGVFYLLLIEENIPDEVITIMSKYGYTSEIVIKRRVRNEHQLVLKFYKHFITVQ